MLIALFVASPPTPPLPSSSSLRHITSFASLDVGSSHAPFLCFVTLLVSVKN